MFTGRVVGPDSPQQWLETDLGYALAWQADKRATCTGCGTRADEWDEDEIAYIGDQIRCEGCAAIAQEQNNIPKGPDGSPRPGVHVYLAPREVYEARHADDPAGDLEHDREPQQDFDPDDIFD